MADFNTGDRIVKMSGVNAGKYGTINSISDSGTLNVTFDGERLPRFCDPERCGKIGLNATYAVGDRVKFNVIRGFTPVPKTGKVRSVSKIGPSGDMSSSEWYYIDVDGGGSAAVQAGNIVGRNAACNRASVYEYGVGDTVKLRSGRTGEVLSKYVDKDGNLSIEINLNGTRYAVSADMVDSVVKNSRACNASLFTIPAIGDRVRIAEGADSHVGEVGEIVGKKGSGYVVRFKTGKEDDFSRSDLEGPLYGSNARNAVSDVRAYKLLDDGRAEIDMTTVGWKSRMHHKETLREMEEQAKKESVDTLKRVLATAKGTMLAKLAEKELARRGIKNACRNAWTDSALLALGDEVIEVKGKFALLYNRFEKDYAVRSRDGERWELGPMSESAALKKFAAKAWNACARNAEVDPKVKAAYDKYMKAKAKFDKWWTPDRRLSERSKVVDEHQRAQMDFARTFREVYGKPTPNGWGDMTLEQMVSKIG